MMRNDAVSQQSAEGLETGPISDDEPIFTTPNRQRIIAAGKLARAEQERLERELQGRRG